jgi:hypothetical protein
VLNGSTNGMETDSQPPQPEPANRKRRRRAQQLHVPVFPEEADAIRAQAQAVGMTLAAYMRTVAMGYQPRATVDRDRIDDMLRINGDLGRLGGLLKLFLSDDAKLKRFDPGQISKTIVVALKRIEDTQAELRGVVQRALREGGP